ncbi:MAG TPA: MgtC/SapB family protein [Geobacteraceae bacterium]
MTNYALEIQFLFRLGLAGVCGAVLGYEREVHGRSAGLRTNLLVCVGSALMTIVSENFYLIYSGNTSFTLRMDPARVAAQIVVGIGFIGAGVIIKETGGIRGLTTAATLWLVAGVGMACGIGMFSIAAATTLIALIALTLLKRIEKIIPRDNYKVVEIVCSESEESALPTLTEFFKAKKLEMLKVSFNHDTRNFVTTYEFSMSCKSCDEIIIDITRELTRFEFVSQVKVT